MNVKSTTVLSNEHFNFMFFHLSHSKSPKPQKPREKQGRVWEMGGSSTKELDYTKKDNNSPNGDEQHVEAQIETVRSSYIIFFCRAQPINRCG